MDENILHAGKEVEGGSEGGSTLERHYLHLYRQREGTCTYRLKHGFDYNAEN